MSVLIKGMEMPTVGRILIVFPSGRVLEVSADATQNIFRETQSVPVPPHGRLVEWIPFESRPMDDEERKYYSEMARFDMSDDAVIYCSKLPEDGQEVLICDKYGNVWQDIFCDDPEYGVGLETHGDMDGIVAWMPTPEPYKPEEDE